MSGASQAARVLAACKNFAKVVVGVGRALRNSSKQRASDSATEQRPLHHSNGPGAHRFRVDVPVIEDRRG